MNIPNLNITKAGQWQSPEGISRSIPRFVLRYELEYYLDDGGETWVDGVRYALTKGNVLFCTPGQIRFSRFPLKARYLYFETEDTGEFAEFLNSIPTYISSMDNVGRLMELSEKAYTSSDYKSRLKVCCNLLNCLVLMSEKGNKRLFAAVHPHQDNVYRAISYMKEHLREKKTVSDFASCTGYSVPHFNAVFKKLMHITPYEYYMKLKVAEAKRLLLSGKYNTTEIAAVLGFSSGSHFCSVFRKNVKSSPGEFINSFRKNNNLESEEII